MATWPVRCSSDCSVSVLFPRRSYDAGPPSGWMSNRHMRAGDERSWLVGHRAQALALLIATGLCSECCCTASPLPVQPCRTTLPCCCWTAQRLESPSRCQRRQPSCSRGHPWAARCCPLALAVSRPAFHAATRDETTYLGLRGMVDALCSLPEPADVCAPPSHKWRCQATMWAATNLLQTHVLAIYGSRPTLVWQPPQAGCS